MNEQTKCRVLMGMGKSGINAGSYFKDTHN